MTLSNLFQNALLLLVALLLTACGGAPAAPTLPPTATANIQAAVESTLTALAPTTTPGPRATLPPEPTATETPIVVTLPPTLGKSIQPPLTITLPDGWKVAQNDALVMPDADNTIRTVPFVAYEGPVTGGTGTIVLLWGFPNLFNPLPQNGTPSAPDLWSDGLRLLRLAIVEANCNVGTDLKRSFRVGNLSAVGTQFAAVDCPELPDTRGWFAGLQNDGLNFIFYVYGDPITVMDTSSGELQAILDTVLFTLPEATPEASPP
jgi:hypothetical protein